MEDPLFSLLAQQGDEVTTVTISRSPGFVLRTRVVHDGGLNWSAVPIYAPADLPRACTALSDHLDPTQVVEVLDAMAALGPEFAAAIAKLKHQRYGIVQAAGP